MNYEVSRWIEDCEGEGYWATRGNWSLEEDARAVYDEYRQEWPHLKYRLVMRETVTTVLDEHEGNA